MKDNMQKGFTLVELLISIAIIATVSVIGLVNLTGHREKLAVDLETEKIVSYLRATRDKAIAGEGNSSWGVRFVNNSSDDDVYYLFQGLSFSSSSIVETRYLSKKTQLLVPPVGSTTDIIFAKGTGYPNASTTLSIQSRTRPQFTGTISINSLGQINY
jgi:prepilin-type N-terminal cleavage/methylation domain-containing protein